MFFSTFLYMGVITADCRRSGQIPYWIIALKRLVKYGAVVHFYNANNLATSSSSSS